MYIPETGTHLNTVAFEKYAARIRGTFLDPLDLDDLGSSQELFNGDVNSQASCALTITKS